MNFREVLAMIRHDGNAGSDPFARSMPGIECEASASVHSAERQPDKPQTREAGLTASPATRFRLRPDAGVWGIPKTRILAHVDAGPSEYLRAGVGADRISTTTRFCEPRHKTS